MTEHSIIQDEVGKNIREARTYGICITDKTIHGHKVVVLLIDDKINTGI